MKHFFLIFILSLGLQLKSQNLEVYDSFDDFSQNLTPDNSKVYVVNYWATWCAPCVKELPYFESLHQQFKDNNIEVVLVSIDFENQRERRLLPFIEKNSLKSRLIHLTDPKTNDWIDKVDPSWSGAIPITLFVRGPDTKFMEKQFPSYESLEAELSSFLKS